MPQLSADTRRQAETSISAGEALCEFEPEFEPIPVSVIVSSEPGHPPIPQPEPVTRASAAVPHRKARVGAPSPRVISPLVAFVLGFALAASMAWLSRPSGTSTVTSGDGPPLSAVEPALAASSAPVASVAPIIGPLPVTVPRAKTAVTTPARTPRLNARAAVSSPVRAPRQSAATQFHGMLAVSSQPNGAEVLLNGTPVGRTPMVLNRVPAGSHAVFVRQDGYAPWSSSVRVVADQRTQVRPNLTPLGDR